MTSLYQLVADYRQDLAVLENLDLDEQTVVDTLEGMRGELEQKSTNVAMFVRNMEATAEAIKAAESQMSVRRKAIENRAKRIRQYLLDCMQQAGIQKIDSPHFAIAIKKNPASVDIFDEKQIPADYWVEPPPPPKTVSKTLIAQAIKDGYEVPGARLQQGVRLEIK